MIQHNMPSLGKEEISAVSAAIGSKWLVRGPLTKRFEKDLSGYIGVKYALATNTGTSALHLALKALGIKDHDEVIMPSYVCTALLDAVNYVRAKPVIVDIGQDSFNISAAEVKKNITDKTKAIIVPHMFGMPADISEIKEFGIPIIEDCAHSIGAKINNKKVGKFGDISIFSFYSSKMLATGEGGMLLTKSKDFFCIADDLIGYDKPKYKVRYNYKMSELQAALGIVQLSKLDYFIQRRRKIASLYDSLLKDFSIVLPVHAGNKFNVYYRYVIRSADSLKLIKHMYKNGIKCIKPVFRPLHDYLNLPGFKNTDNAFKTGVSIPIYPEISDKQVKKICIALKNA